MKNIGIAVIGAGLFGRKHIETMRLDKGCRLVAIADPTPEAAAYARELEVPCFADYGEMLDTVRPDAAIVATPNVLHVPAGLACIARGIPLLVEKPIADKVADALQLTEAAEGSGVALLVGHHRRHNPIIEMAREVVRSGWIGQVTAISAQWMLLKAQEYFEAVHRRSPGAGPVLTNAVHDIDDLRYICGDIVAVQAMTSNAVRGYPVEDTAAILLRFANGALGTLTVSDTAVGPWSWELTAGENPFYPRNDENCYLISGTEGALSVPRLELWRYGEQQGWGAPLARECLQASNEDPLVRQLRHLCAVVRGEAEPKILGRDAVQTLRAVQAIFESAASGCLIRVGDENR